jgi:hypothetical protein
MRNTTHLCTLLDLEEVGYLYALVSVWHSCLSRHDVTPSSSKVVTYTEISSQKVMGRINYLGKNSLSKIIF